MYMYNNYDYDVVHVTRFRTNDVLWDFPRLAPEHKSKSIYSCVSRARDVRDRNDQFQSSLSILRGE